MAIFRNWTKLLPHDFKLFKEAYLKVHPDNRVGFKKDPNAVLSKDLQWWGFKQGKTIAEWSYAESDFKLNSDKRDADVYRMTHQRIFKENTDIKSLDQILEQEHIVAKHSGLTLRSDDGEYSYVHSDYCAGTSVAVLGWKRTGKDGYNFIGRFEEIPAHKTGIKLVSLTGGFETNDNPGSCAKREFYEEANIQADISEFKYIGYIYPYKGATTLVHLFAIDCANYEPGAGPGDGSNIEANAYCKWISETELTESTDPILHALYMRWRRAFFSGRLR